MITILHTPHVIPFFHAKEDKRTSNSNFQYKQKSPAIPKCAVNPNPGSSEIICNSSASHPSQDTSLLPFMAPRRRHMSRGPHRTNLDSVGFLKGWNENWKNLVPPNYPRIDELLDRDNVWVVTQTMVIFEHLALWAVHTLLTYKVYPGFWGRANLYHNNETGLMIQDLGYQIKVTW